MFGKYVNGLILAKLCCSVIVSLGGVTHMPQICVDSRVPQYFHIRISNIDPKASFLSGIMTTRQLFLLCDCVGRNLGIV